MDTFTWLANSKLYYTRKGVTSQLDKWFMITKASEVSDVQGMGVATNIYT